MSGLTSYLLLSFTFSELECMFPTFYNTCPYALHAQKVCLDISHLILQFSSVGNHGRVWPSRGLSHRTGLRTKQPKFMQTYPNTSTHTKQHTLPQRASESKSDTRTRTHTKTAHTQHNTRKHDFDLTYFFVQTQMQTHLFYQNRCKAAYGGPCPDGE
jgi:hypothetical protein